jgi:hypothetical protein
VRPDVERPELVPADDHGGVARGGLPIGDLVELEDSVLLRLEVRVVAHLERLDHLKRDAFLAEQDLQALVADVVDHLLSHQELG